MRRGVLAVALICLAPAVGRAQAGDVGVVVDEEVRDRAFLELLDVPPERRFTDVEVARRDPSLGFVVDLRVREGVARVWRRSDHATLERRLAEPDAEGYAVAVVASELLEVARAGSTAEVVSIDPPTDPLSQPSAGAAPDGDADPATDGPAEPTPPEPAATATESPPLAGEEGGDVSDRLAFTAVAAFEAWAMPDGPWQLQPALALELAWIGAGQDWQLSVGLFGAGGGQSDREVSRVEGRYNRVDGGLRVGIGGWVGPARTRLLAHARGGASAVIMHAEEEGNARRRASTTQAGGFVGASVEVRQPLDFGLEVSLELGVDAIVEPLVFQASGVTLLREGPVRLSGRLGVAYRVE